MQNVTKGEILQNTTKQGFISSKFLKENKITAKECYDIVYKTKQCKYCKYEADFNSWKHGYKETCSNKDCKKKSRKEKTEKTNLERYGVKNISQLQEIKDRKLESSIKTCQERYGVDNPFQVKEFMYKDNRHVSQTKEIQEKRNTTLTERYETSDPLSINDGRERGIFKCNNDKEVQDKREQTNIDKYGAKNTFQSRIIQDKVIQTKNKIGIDGLTSHQRIHKNKVNDIDENGLNSYERVHELRLNDIDENGLNSYQRAMIKIRKTNEDNGYWITEEFVEDFKDYYKLVWRYTNNQDLESLNNFHLRGHANKGMYHLDHKFSIFEGYLQDIPAKIIGDICNLEMIVGRNNLSKGKKCSITKKELYHAYEK